MVTGGHQALGADDGGALDHAGHAPVVQNRHQRLAHTQLHEHILRPEGGVLPERLDRGLHRLLLGGGVRPQGVLDPVGELSQDAVGNVAGGLGDKVHPHSLGADKLDHLLYLLHQGLGGVGKEHVGLVKEEHQLGPVLVPRLRQLLKELGEHPQQEGGVEGRVLDQLDAAKDIHHPLAVRGVAHPVVDVQVGLPEEEVAPLPLQRQQSAQNAAQRLGGNVAVGGGKLVLVVAHIAQHGPQVLHVQQQKAVVVGDLEDDLQHPLLGGGEAQDAAQQAGAHVGDGAPHRVAHLLVDVPKGHRVALVRKGVPQAELVDALLHPLALCARLGQTGHVPLYVAEEHGYPRVGEGFGHHLHGDGLARSAGSGDETVAVSHFEGQVDPSLVAEAQIKISIAQIHFFVLLMLMGDPASRYCEGSAALGPRPPSAAYSTRRPEGRPGSYRTRRTSRRR